MKTVDESPVCHEPDRLGLSDCGNIPNRVAYCGSAGAATARQVVANLFFRACRCILEQMESANALHRTPARYAGRGFPQFQVSDDESRIALPAVHLMNAASPSD